MLLLAASSAMAQEASESRRSIFVEEARPPFADYELPWFDIETTYTEEHFDPVFLPFHYECREGEPDENQTYTFPHLLSFKFDHVPDNLTRAHPFFVFKRSRRELKEMRDELDDVGEETAARFLAVWECNVAFGGSLIQEGDRFGGRLVAYDADGRRISARRYAVEHGYFELMGAMVRDWMTSAGYEVSDGLGKELDRAMCADFEAVRLLGTAALAREKSRKVFDIYEEVLRIAPEFAEIRYWLANQREWADGDDERGRAGRAAALESHLVPFALLELDARSGDDRDLQDRALEWIAYARSISPRDARYAEIEIEERDDQWNLTLGQLEPYVADCLASPTYSHLHQQLAFEFRSRHALERALPIAVSGLRSHLDYERDGIWIELAIGFLLSGEHGRALECARQGLLDTEGGRIVSLLHLTAAQALRQRSRFVEAIDELTEAYRVGEHRDILALAILTGHEAGDATVEARFGAVDLGDSVWGPLLAARRFVALGWIDRAAEALPDCAMKSRHWPAGFDDRTQIIDIRLETEVLRADVAFLRGDREGFEEAAVHAWKLDPLGGRTRSLLVRAFGTRGELPPAWRRAERFLAQPLEPVFDAATGHPREQECVDAKDRARVLEERQAVSTEAEARRMWQSRGPWEIEALVLDLARCGEVERAVDLYVSYLTCAEELSDPLQIMTRIYVRKLLALGDETLRTRVLARLAALPSGPGWHVQKQAELLYRADRYAEALPLFRKAARMKDKRVYWHHFYVGVCLRELGQLDASVVEMETYLSHHPDDANARYEAARSYAALDRHAEAYDSIRRHFELRGDDDELEHADHLLRDAGLALAREELARGDARAASERLETLVALGVGDAEVEALAARCRAALSAPKDG